MSRNRKDTNRNMRRFPDFAELLTPIGRRAMDGRVPKFNSMLASKKTPFALLTGLIDREKAQACVRLLDRHLYDLLSVESTPIDPRSVTSVKKNYGESLPKVMRFKTAFLSKRSAKSYVAAEKAGFLEMLRSESFTAFAQALTGYRLSSPPNLQILCYEHGDYVGPHNDHFPEEDPQCRGYIDVHVTLSNRAVAHQYLIYEKNRHLSQMVDVNLEGSISIYKLPFWHQVTPLAGKPGREAEARRWLLIGTFEFLDGRVPAKTRRQRITFQANEPCASPR